MGRGGSIALRIALILPGFSTSTASSTATLSPAVIYGFSCRCSRVLLLRRWTLLHLGFGFVRSWVRWVWIRWPQGHSSWPPGDPRAGRAVPRRRRLPRRKRRVRGSTGRTRTSSRMRKVVVPS